MLQPKSYPELMGKALVLDADPFITLADDDNPWIEGLSMVVSAGVLLAIAHLVGGLLLTASLPPADAIRATLLQGWRAVTAAGPGTAADPRGLEEALVRAWEYSAGLAGLQGGPARLFYALFAPLGLMVQWLTYGLAGHVAARILGGQGRLSQMLGTSALVAAPYLLALLTVIPFVAVSRLLLAVWGVLILYRAVQVTHDLSWQRALLATAAALLFLAVLTSAAGFTIAMLLVGFGGLV